MQPDSRHAKAPELRPRIFASPQTTDARWLPIHLHALSSTHRWRDPARRRRRIATAPFSLSLYFLPSESLSRFFAAMRYLQHLVEPTPSKRAVEGHSLSNSLIPKR